MTPFHQRPQAHQVVPTAPPSSPRRRRGRDVFRWEYLFVPLLLLGVMWLLSGVDGAAFTFDDVMDHLNVRNKDQYRQLATLGVIAVAVVGCAKVLRPNRHRG